MVIKEDTTYRDIKEKSVFQWLDEMSVHDDISVRCGVKATKEYIESLKSQIDNLEDKNKLKDAYLKKMKESVRNN